MRGFQAFPLGLLLLAVLFAPANAIGRASVNPAFCDETYSRIGGVYPKAHALQRPKEYQAVFDTYSNDNLGRRRQITDLLDLRLELEQRGKIVDPAREVKYNALEWRNLHEGLIDGDLDGIAFIGAIRKFSAANKQQKLEGIAAFANSHHPEFGQVLAKLIDHETDDDVLRALREVAALRRIPISYKNPRLLEAIASEGRHGGSQNFAVAELAQLPAQLVDRWLNSGEISKSMAATAGFTGRDNEFLFRYFGWPNTSVQVHAIDALSIGSNVKHEINMLEGMLLHSKDKWVREAAVRKLAQYSDERANEVLRKWLEKNPEYPRHGIGLQALNWAQDLRMRAAEWERLSSNGNYIGHLMADVMGTDSAKALNATTLLLPVSIEKKIEALKAPLAEVRAEVAKRAMQFSPDSKKVVGKILLEDKVADLRLLGLNTLSHNGVGADPEVFRMIKTIAEADEDMEVRRRALELISVRDTRGRVFNQSREATYAHYLAKARAELGAPEVRERDIIPYATANHIYEAPEALLGKTPEELALMHKRFQETAPVGYKVAKLETDPESGFVGAIYTSADSMDRPLIVSIAGTWTKEDVLADANLGVKQARSQAFRDLVGAARAAAIMNSKAPEIVVTGHSLGGGMSQVFGHELITELQSTLNPELAKKVRVVSFNGFGGEEALKRIGSYKLAVAKEMKAVNYYVPWDPVSMLGNHIGESIKLPHLGTRNPGVVHKMGSVGKAFLEKGGLVGDLGETRGRRYLIPAVTRVIGPALDKLSYLKYKVREKKIFADLCQARLDWAANEDYKRLKPEYDWLKPELERAAENMFGAKRRDEARKMLQWVESQRLKIIRERQAPDAAIPPG